MQGHEIGFPEQGLKGLQRCPQFWFFPRRQPVPAMVEDLHAETGGPLGHGLADPPHTDDFEGLAVHFLAEEKEGRPAMKFALPDTSVPGHDPAGGGQDQGKARSAVASR